MVQTSDLQWCLEVLEWRVQGQGFIGLKGRWGGGGGLGLVATVIPVKNCKNT